MGAPQSQRQPEVPGARGRILRIGILLGGKIVEERLIRERANVSIGQSMKNTFSIPVEGLPLEFTLFALDHGTYSLRFLQNMDGRVSDGGNVRTLDALKSQGARRADGHWEMALTPTSRGKLSLGDLTILFQFVTEPPQQPKPMLPVSVRGTLADRLDPRLSAILGASLLFHFTIVVIAMLTDVENNNSIADRAYNLTFAPEQYTVDVEQPKPDKPSDGAGSASKAPDKPKPKASDSKPSQKPSDSGRNAKSDVALQEQQAAAMAALLTGEGPNGSSEGDMSKRRPGADLGQQISDVREGGKAIAVGGGSGRGSRGDGDARVGTGKGPNINGPGGTETAGGPKTERGPSGRIQVSDKQSFDESSLTPDIVLSKIQSVYMAQIKRCYTNYLKKDASARGKIQLKLTVNETGRAVKTSASGLASEVDDCIANLMVSWRFPVPKDKDNEPTEASFSIALQLIPE